jgi:hypothetical protein
MRIILVMGIKSRELTLRSILDWRGWCFAAGSADPEKLTFV